LVGALCQLLAHWLGRPHASSPSDWSSQELLFLGVGWCRVAAETLKSEYFHPSVPGWQALRGMWGKRAAGEQPGPRRGQAAGEGRPLTLTRDLSGFCLGPWCKVRMTRMNRVARMAIRVSREYFQTTATPRNPLQILSTIYVVLNNFLTAHWN
jgi:hypothetical protein